MNQEHVTSSDPRHVHHADSVYTFECSKCGETLSTYVSYKPNCRVCQSAMLQKKTLQGNVVKEIKNRTVSKDIKPLGEGQQKKGRKGRFNDGLVAKSMTAVIHPRGSGKDIRLAINIDDEAFAKGTVMLKWGELSLITSVNEIGGAFHKFDPSPVTIKRETPEGPIFEKVYPETRRGMTKIGPIEVWGGTSRQSFLDTIVEFVHGVDRAKFSMTDIALVLTYAL